MSKLKQSADDNFKFDENSRKFSKRLENTVGKGEIARYEQFLLFPQCFQKACFPGALKGVIVWEWIKEGNMLIYWAFFQNVHLVITLSSQCNHTYTLMHITIKHIRKSHAFGKKNI